MKTVVRIAGTNLFDEPDEAEVWNHKIRFTFGVKKNPLVVFSREWDPCSDKIFCEEDQKIICGLKNFVLGKTKGEHSIYILLPKTWEEQENSELIWVLDAVPSTGALLYYPAELNP